MTVCLDLWVRRETLSMMGEIDVFSPQAWGPWDSRITRASCMVHNQCISKVKELWSSSVTLANAMHTSVINSRVVLIVPLICHVERVYKQIIPCKKSLSIKVNCVFLHKITALVQNLPKATITLLPRKNWTYGIFPFLSFYFHSSYVNKTNWRKCFQNYSSQNAAIQENLKTNEVYGGHIKSNIQLLIFINNSWA